MISLSKVKKLAQKFEENHAIYEKLRKQYISSKSSVDMETAKNFRNTIQKSGDIMAQSFYRGLEQKDIFFTETNFETVPNVGTQNTPSK